MNTYRNLVVVILAATTLVLFAPSKARAQMNDERMQVTFSAPVEVPGEVLPAGSYIFETLENGQVTRILSSDQKHLYATLLTVPDERREPTADNVVLMRESSKGAPEKVQAWFYPGDTVGSEFVYHKER